MRLYTHRWSLESQLTGVVDSRQITRQNRDYLLAKLAKTLYTEGQGADV
jgi:hypothetical protein